MRILLFPVGSAGDVHPFIGLAQRLRDRGHHATLFTSAYFEEAVTRAGVDFVPTLPAADFIRMEKNADLWKPVKSMKALFDDPTTLDMIRLQIRLVREHMVAKDTVVVAGRLALGARLATESLAVPVVSMHLQPVMFLSMHRTATYAGSPLRPWWPTWLKRAVFWTANRYVVDPILGPKLNAVRAELGLPPVRRIITHWVHSPDRVIGLFPRWYAEPAADWPSQARVTGFPLYDERDIRPMPAALDAFLAAGSPPVAATFGSAMRFAAPHFEAVVAALKARGRRGVLLTRYAEQIPPNLPAEIVHVAYAPLSRLLPHCAALIHHGGIGTAAQAMAAGVPQLVMPMAHDQPDNAERLRRLGIGLAIPPRRFTASRVAVALDQLAKPEVAAKCEAVAGRFRDVDPIAETCQLIEQVPIEYRG